MRTLEFTAALTGTDPNFLMLGGIQGEDLATKVRFNLAADLVEKLTALGFGNIRYRFEIYDSTGVVDLRDVSALQSDVTSLEVELSNRNTQNGGRIKVFLVLFSTAGSQMEYFTYPAVIKLEGKPSASAKDYESLSELAVNAKAAAERAEGAAVRAATSEASSLSGANRTEAAKAIIESESEWIFDGGELGGDGALSFGIAIDNEISEDSPNPVKNSAVAGAIANLQNTVNLLIEQVNNIPNTILDKIAPIGCVKLFAKNTTLQDIQAVYGTDTYWERITDRYLRCAGESDAGETGGQNSVTLALNQIPDHQHERLIWGSTDTNVNFESRSGSTSGNALLFKTSDKLYGGYPIKTGPVIRKKNESISTVPIEPQYIKLSVWKRVS